MSNSKKTVLVLGATGNLGAYISIHLRNKGYNVIAASRRKSDNGFFADHGIAYYSFDVKDISTFDNLPQNGIDVVAHFAGELPSRYEFNPSDLINNITIGTINVLEYMRRIGCNRIIYPQTPYDIISHYDGKTPLKADLPQTFPLTGDHAVYAISKNAAINLIEHYHHEYNFDRFILRFFTIYQYHPNAYHFANFKRRMMPFRMLMDRAMKSQPIEIWGNASKAKEMVYIKDFTELVRCCIDAECSGGCYNVGNGRQVTLDEQIHGIVDVFSPKDNPSELIYVPDKPDPLVNAFDISKTIKELGWQPKYSYIDQLKDFKSEMDNEPFAKLWGTKNDYTE